MDVKQFYWVILVISSFFKTPLGAPPEPNTRSFRNALNQQNIQTILQSIEDRLRNLDQIYSLRYSQRSDLNADQFFRKIEMLETKLSRMESMLEVQLEKLSENMSSKNFRDDIAKDQIFRKIDSVYERINHKLGYIEEKFEMSAIKLQNKIETGLTKIDRLDHSINVRQADMESEISESIQLMENVKNNVYSLEQKILNGTKHTMQNYQENQEHLIKSNFITINNTLAQIEKRLINKSIENEMDFVNDFSNKDAPRSLQNYGAKMNNMYNELWKKSTAIENTVKNSAQLMNITRKEIQDNITNLLTKSGNTFSTHNKKNDGTLEMLVESFTNTLQRKFSELGRKMETNFENIMLAQNLFLESCHRIQIDETQLETKISLVLEKLLESFNNRSVLTLKELQTMQELLKSHDSNIYKTINQSTSTIMKLSEKTSEDRKKIEKNLSTLKKEISNVVEAIENEMNIENLEITEKLDSIGHLAMELQAQVNDLDEKMNKDNINYNAKQMLQDLLTQTKDIFEKQLNISVIHNAETITKVDNFIKDIYQRLRNIDTKINKYADEEIRYNKVNFSNIHLDNKQDTSDDHVDVVLNILPDTYNTNHLLSRFNYSIIQDRNDLNIKSNKTDINKQNSLNNTQNEEPLSTENYQDTENQIINTNYSIFDNKTAEKNNITSEETNADKISQATTIAAISSDFDTNNKIASYDTDLRKTDVVKDILGKLIESFVNFQQNNNGFELPESKKSNNCDDCNDAINSTTDVADITDYNYEFDD